VALSPFPNASRSPLSLIRALEHLHSHGLVHRDIKPSNIIFVNGVPKLADIGLVTSVDATRSFVGTDGYIPPEGPGTPQADLYSLGKVIYECVTGKDRLDFPELPTHCRARPDFDQLLELNEILTKVCDADRSQRFQSAAEMRLEIELLQTGKSIRVWRSLGQRRAALRKGALAFIILTLVAGGLVIVLHKVRPVTPGDGRPSRSSDANTLCERAMFIIRGDNYDALPEAYADFQKAIERDSQFARAYAGLLELRLRESIPGVDSMKPNELRIIADKLHELAPGMAATHCAQSILAYGNLDFLSASDSAMKAIGADQKYELAHTEYGFMLLAWGRPGEARVQFGISRNLNAAKGTIQCGLGHTYYVERDYTNAIARYRKVTEVDPRHAFAYQCIGETYRAMRNYTSCIENMEKADLMRGGSVAKTKESYDRFRQAIEERGARGYWEECWKAEMDPSY
jgi:tetratricopeptide (TPR) repeat protein